MHINCSPIKGHPFTSHKHTKISMFFHVCIKFFNHRHYCSLRVFNQLLPFPLCYLFCNTIIVTYKPLSYIIHLFTEFSTYFFCDARLTNFVLSYSCSGSVVNKKTPFCLFLWAILNIITITTHHNIQHNPNQHHNYYAISFSSTQICYQSSTIH